MVRSYILLVEDNQDDNFLASRIIRNACTDTIIVACDGEEALDLLQKMASDGSHHLIRLVLLDLKLPKISGLEVLRAIRENEATRGLPVAVLTSSDNDLDQERCRTFGVLDYILKPITAEQLQSVLSRDKDA